MRNINGINLLMEDTRNGNNKMTKTEWFQLAESNRAKLLNLILEFHPMNRSITGIPEVPDIVMSAELACQNVRAEIRKNWEGGGATVKFMRALDTKDFKTAYSVLDETWFGVPESASYAWSREGFKECVVLLEDPVE